MKADTAQSSEIRKVLTAICDQWYLVEELDVKKHWNEKQFQSYLAMHVLKPLNCDIVNMEELYCPCSKRSTTHCSKKGKTSIGKLILICCL